MAPDGAGRAVGADHDRTRMAGERHVELGAGTVRRHGDQADGAHLGCRRVAAERGVERREHRRG